MAEHKEEQTGILFEENRGEKLRERGYGRAE